MGSWILLSVGYIDAHGLNIQGGLEVFAKIPRGGRGGQGFKEKSPGGSPYFGFFIAILLFINKFFENLPGGCCFIPPSPPLCVSMVG